MLLKHSKYLVHSKPRYSVITLSMVSVSIKVLLGVEEEVDGLYSRRVVVGYALGKMGRVAHPWWHRCSAMESVCF